ncbi:YfhO family protein [Paenibacillus sp. GM1FR]|uniref:YfhO family protein n=1 Tax=Paenibacillus sp. GM1FR TaxID=2059267 RepID=UPI00325FB119
MSLYYSRWFNVVLFIFFFCIPFILYWNLFISDKGLVSGDGVQYYSSKALIKYSFSQGEFPFWNKFLANGTPYAADFTNHSFYPFTILLSLFPLKIFMYSFYAIHLAIGAFFMYLFIKEMGCGKVAALCTALIYQLSIHLGGYRKEHIMIIATIIYLPAILYFLQKYINTKSIKWLLFSSVAMAFQFYVAFIQDVVYTDIIAGIFLFILGIKNKMKIKKLITAGLVWTGAYFGLIAFQFLPTLQLVREYGEDGAASATLEYFQSYSIHFSKLVMMLFPRIYAGEVYQPFGSRYSSELDIEIFLGSVVFLVLLFGAFRYFSDFRVKISLGMMLGAFLFSASVHVPLLSELLYRIPGINGFRVLPRALFVFIFFAFVLFAVTLSKLRIPEQMSKFYQFSKWFMLGLCTFLGVAFFANVINLMSISNFESAKPIYQYFKTTFLPGLIVLFLVIIISYLIQKGSGKWSKAQYGKVYGCLGIIIVLMTFFETYTFSTALYSGNPKNIADYGLNDDASKFISENIGDSKVWDASSVQSNTIDMSTSLTKGFSTINAFITFNNPRIYKLLSNDSSQVPINNSGLLRNFQNSKSSMVEQNDLLSMLGIKYIISDDNPISGEAALKETIQEGKTIFRENSIEIPDSKGELFVYSQPAEIKPNTFYKIHFDIDSTENQSLFYVDFYGGENYDSDEQQKMFNVQSGVSEYSAVLYSGDTTGIEHINLRIISMPTSKMKVTKFSLAEIPMQIQKNVYKSVFVEGSNHIYENTNAKDILFVPQKIQNIKNMEDIYRNQYEYDLLNVSYIENFKNMNLIDANTTIREKNFKNNSITATVHSDKPSFVNFSQNYYPGWRAKVNGKETPIYVVNGLIQGIEVPKGDSEIEIYFYPKIFYVGAFITLLTLAIMAYLFIKERRRLSS